MFKKLTVFILCLFYSFSAHGSDFNSVLEKFINKKIDGCVITNVKYNESTNDILIVCVKNTTKIYHFYLDIKAGLECGDFKCGSKNITKDVLNFLSK